MSKNEKLDQASRTLPAPFNARLAGRISANDGRSAEARFKKRLRAALFQHVGGTPTVTQAGLIDLAVDTALEIERMKCRRAGNGSLSIHDHKAFLAYVNSYRRHLAALGVNSASSPKATLADHLATRAA